MDRTSLALAAAALLAGCSGPAPAPSADGAPTNQPVAVEDAGPAPAAGGTIGGDGSELRLTPLTAEDIDGNAVEGELACGFSTEQTGAPLLLARGDVASDDPAFGLIRIGDVVERVAAPGGYDAMVGGTRFSGRGMTVTVAPTGAADGGGERPPRPATLTADRADGARRVFEGWWTCGP